MNGEETNQKCMKVESGFASENVLHMGPTGLHPRMLREMAVVLARLVFIVFERLWRSRETSGNRRKANLVPIFRKGQKKSRRPYPSQLHVIPWENHGVSPLEACFQTQEGEQGGWEQPVRVDQG